VLTIQYGLTSAVVGLRLLKTEMVNRQGSFLIVVVERADDATQPERETSETINRSFARTHAQRPCAPSSFVCRVTGAWFFLRSTKIHCDVECRRQGTFVARLLFCFSEEGSSYSPDRLHLEAG
jgi:hypothetical protein